MQFNEELLHLQATSAQEEMVIGWAEISILLSTSASTTLKQKERFPDYIGQIVTSLT